MHYVLIFLARLTRLIRGWVLKILLVAFLISLNVATVISGAVYDTVGRLVWGLVATVSDELADRRPLSRAELEAQNKAARSQADAARIETERTRAELETSKAENGRVKTDLEIAEARNRELSLDLDRNEKQFANQRAALEAQNRTARSEANAARFETERTRTELETSKAENGRVKADLEIAEARNKDLSLDLDRNEKRLANISADLETSRVQRKQALETMDGLKGRVVRSIRRNASIELLEGVPLIGAALVLGSMAYDVNDACEQLRALEGIDSALRGTDVATSFNQDMCLMSYDDLVAAFTGKDRGYATCIADRIALSELNPPSCAGYDPALPDIEDSVSDYRPAPVKLPEIK